MKTTLEATGPGSRFEQTRRRRKQPKDNLLKESLGALLGRGIGLIGFLLVLGVVLCWNVRYSQRVSVPLTVVDTESAKSLPVSPGHVLAVGSVPPALTGALSDHILQVQLEGYPESGWIEAPIRSGSAAGQSRESANLVAVELPETWQSPSGDEIRLYPGLRATGSAMLSLRLLERLFGSFRSSLPWA